jgi:NAD(P)-dependent dehydrogenase (short-subunit alcohol dehydrogenase family)
MRWTGYPYFAYYAAKAAVNQATVALAIQYARQGIRANCSMPGLIDTPLIYKQISSEYGSVEDMVTARKVDSSGRRNTVYVSCSEELVQSLGRCVRDRVIRAPANGVA